MHEPSQGGHVKLARTAGSLLVAALVVGTMAFTGAGTALADGNGGSFHGDHHHNGPATLFVSPSGQSGNSDWSCNSAAYSTIGAAVSAASPWATVVVCGGTYHEQVVINQPLSLEGRNHATIDETGVTPTFSVPMPPGPPITIYAGIVIISSHVEVENLTITGAMGEGIIAAGLAAPITHVDINDNKVVNNDLGGGVPPASPYFQCAANGQIPGDCGEGIHFIGGVAWSEISDNFVSGNSGGILLSDDIGPTHDKSDRGQHRDEEPLRLRDHRAEPQRQRPRRQRQPATVGRPASTTTSSGTTGSLTTARRARAQASCSPTPDRGRRPTTTG